MEDLVKKIVKDLTKEDVIDLWMILVDDHAIDKFYDLLGEELHNVYGGPGLS